MQRHTCAGALYHVRPQGPSALTDPAIDVACTHLPPAAPPAKLTAVPEAPVKVDADGPVVQHGPVQVLDAVLRVGADVVDDEAEAAGGHLLTVQAHDDALDVPRLAENLGMGMGVQGAKGARLNGREGWATPPLGVRRGVQDATCVRGNPILESLFQLELCAGVGAVITPPTPRIFAPRW